MYRIVYYHYRYFPSLSLLLGYIRLNMYGINGNKSMYFSVLLENILLKFPTVLLINFEVDLY